MPSRPSPEARGAVAANRCRCGHLPTAHMRSAPVDPTRPDSSYRLVPDGPCEWCGDGACSRYTPGS